MPRCRARPVGSYCIYESCLFASSKWTFASQITPFCYCYQTLRTKSTLSVDPQTFTLGTVSIDWQLAGDGQLMTNLTLARTKLTEDLHDFFFDDAKGNGNTSVMLPVSIPPARILSSSRLPVVICMISARLMWHSVAVVKPMCTCFIASVYITLKWG